MPEKKTAIVTGGGHWFESFVNSGAKSMRFVTLRSCTQCLQICCVFVTAISVALASPQSLAQIREKEPIMKHPTAYQTIQVDGLSIFYREAGPKDAPTILLLHGLPSSSRMFEPLFARLAERYH